ncbi:lantibiotic dehydratase [Streptomyces griseoloalbus]|uniref:lantibiotic dehydratase n=1 Tax=Streptomyces griseoloalbus TaxID=67303 RepID=UPI00296F573E
MVPDLPGEVMAVPAYEPAGFFLLRAPALPARTYLDITADPERTDGRLLDLAGRPDVRRALLVASEDLTHSLARFGRLGAKRTRRVRSGLLRYLTRMSTRPTPFGTFSGVAMGEFGPATTVRLGESPIARTRVRADMGWLLAWIKQLEEDAGLLRHLRVMVNPMAHVAGDRVILPQADKYGQADARSVRIRATPAVDVVMRAAVTPVPYERLLAELTTAFPEAPGEAVSGLVRQMWELGFLVSDLRPSQTAVRPEQDLLKKLADLPVAADAADRLRTVADLAQRADGAESLERLSTAQRALVPDHSGQTYQADAALGLRGAELDASIAEETAEAVGTLMRLSSSFGHTSHLTRYREEFGERYGAGARVPVLTLLSPDAGLDAPPTYTNPARSVELPAQHPPDTRRMDQALLALAQQAWWNHATEVELTDAWVDRIAPHADTTDWPPAMDAYLQIAAADRQAIDRGEWRAVIRSDGLAHGGRTFGRFSDLLGDESVDRLRAYARREERLYPDVVYAELAYLPPYGRAANVAVRPAIRPYEIPVNTPASVPEDRVITLDDILVGATDSRFYLWSKRLDREIVVEQHHMLSPSLAPNVARFLLEVSHDGYVMPTGFHWGTLESAPFLPRVTRGRVTLRPAQWRLTAEDGADLSAWRARFDVPRYVYMTESDHRLLLDLDHPSFRAELEAELKRKPAVVLQEMLPAFDRLWLRDERDQGYVSEVIVPVVLKDARRVTRPPVERQPHVPVERHVPGGEWTYLKIYSAPERHDEIIAGPLRDIVRELRERQLLDRWFYMRYADPFPHLRVRVRSSETSLAPALLTAWGRSLVGQGLAQDFQVAGYVPEIARYGGPASFDAAEAVFEANSEVTAALLAVRPDIRPEFLAVAALDTLHAQWGVPPADRGRHARGTHEDETRKLFQENRDYLCELLSPWDRYTHPRGSEHRGLLEPVLATQLPAVRHAADTVRRAAADGDLVGGEEQILASLAHMQVNRLLPIDLEREARCHGLWSHVLRALRGRMAAEEAP